MKLFLVTVLFCVFLGSAATSKTEPVFGDKEKVRRKKNAKEKTSANKNVHSIKKWKMTIEYLNGNTISKTIVVSKNSKLSALETAFAEADKYLKGAKNIKDYSISPVTNSYVLLAGH